MTTEAFVYRWKHVQTGMVYIGKHKGTEDDGYISSGKLFRKAYQEAPHLFERTILHRGTDADCLRVEGQCIQEAIREYGYENVYNLTHWSMLTENSVKCLACGALCDPRNEEWLRIFTDEHLTGSCGKKKTSGYDSLQDMSLVEMKRELKELRDLRPTISNSKYIALRDRIIALQREIKGYNTRK